MTKYIDLKNNYNKEELEEAAELIKKGELVLFPTETVYGIGANGLDSLAVQKIFIAKGRASDNPLILHISNIDMIDKIAKDITDMERRIIDIFFPGPLTIVLNKKDIVPSVVSANLDTVGIRMPSNKIAHDLIELADTPIAAPSANISGKPSGTNVDDIFEELKDKVSCIIDGGDTDIGLESTVIRVIDNKVKILRPGKITEKDFRSFGFEVDIDNHVLEKVNKDEIVLSPGMKYKHYAPNKECLLIYSEDNNNFINKVLELETESNILVLCKDSNKKYFKNTLVMGETLEEISKNIFSLLRKVDKYDVDLVVIEGVKSEGLGLAIMNRLIRACSHNYMEV